MLKWKKSEDRNTYVIDLPKTLSKKLIKEYNQVKFLHMNLEKMNNHKTV